jgi:hypothetical protein
MEVTRATIGSDSWKKASVKNLQLGNAVMDRSERACELGKELDPLPSLRDNCIQQSNARIHAYVRATRAVVVKLRESLLDTNKEIKSLTRCKESLERALEHVRKDLLLNQRSCEVRAKRPPRERVGFKSTLGSLRCVSMQVLLNTTFYFTEFIIPISLPFCIRYTKYTARLKFLLYLLKYCFHNLKIYTKVLLLKSSISIDSFVAKEMLFETIILPF